jgi:hypothetical protein
MRRWLLLLLVVMLPWQGAWAAELKPCGAGGGCPERRAAAAAMQAVADATATQADATAHAAAEHDGSAQDRCNGDCSACHGQHLPALLTVIDVRLLVAGHIGGSSVLLRPYEVQRAPLLRPPQ